MKIGLSNVHKTLGLRTNKLTDNFLYDPPVEDEQAKNRSRERRKKRKTKS